MALFNKFIRYLTKRHDARNARVTEYTEDRNGKIKLSEVELIPSVMLAFNIIESNRSEEAIVKALGKIFDKNKNLKTQYSSAGETLLFAACKKGSCKVVTFLIDNELNCKQVTPLGTAMHSLFEGLQKENMTFADFEAMNILLQEKGCDINAVNHRQMTPFLCAVEVGNLEAIQLYIKLKCDINQAGVCGYHAIHLTCMKYRPDILQFVVSLKGININPISDDGSTPLFTAVKEWNEMCSKGTCFESTHLDVRFKQCMQVLAVVETLLTVGANPYVLSTKKAVNLPTMLLNVRKEECNKGRWCKNCQENGTKHGEGIQHTPLEHSCNHLYIGCPCKLTSLYIGDDPEDESDPSDDHDRDQSNHSAAGSCNSSQNNINLSNMIHGAANRRTFYGSSAVPLTSQMLATSLLYGQFHFDTVTDNVRSSFLQKSSKLDLVDPYLQYLVKYFQNIEASVQQPSLKMLCRSKLRVCMASEARLNCMQQLPLPKVLLDYVSMKIL